MLCVCLLGICRHLIGFFLFLALTIYTATKVPSVVDLHSLQHRLPDVLRKTDLHKLHAELMSRLPSSPSSWHVMDLLYNCLPERFSHGNYTDMCVLVKITNFLSVPALFGFRMLPSSYLCCCCSVIVLQHSVREDLANLIAPLIFRPITRWPFYAFLGGAMFCLLASSTCHLLSCHSERVSYIMLRLDYAGIAALIATSFYPPVYYSFMCDPFFCNLYLGFITILGIATVLVSLLPVFQSPEFRVVRASLFFGMGFSGAAPILHKLIIFWDQPEALHTTGYEILMGLLYGLGALVYATRIPERWMPGKFDIAGHSHQLFHVLVVAGAFTHYRAGLVYLKWRDIEGC